MGDRNPEEIQNRIQVIVNKMPNWKGRNTAIKNFLSIYLNKPIDVEKIQERMRKYHECFGEFEALMDELANIDPESEHYNIATRFEIESNYYKNIAESERLLAVARGDNTRNRDVHDGAGSSRTETESTHSRAIQRRKPKRSEPILPKFNGNHEHWITFKSEFDALIHTQDDISSVDKLTYLRCCLTGPAYDKIKMLAITEENYPTTWQLLERTYSDTRVIASRHLNLLLYLPVQEKETSTGLTKLVDDTRQHLAALNSLNKNVTEETMITILERKIHDITSDEWNDVVKKRTFPTLDDMLDFLSDRAMRLLNRKREKPSRNNTNYTQGNNRRPFKRSHEQAFLSHTLPKCSLCGENPHPLYRCAKFRVLEVPQRFKVINEGNICINCLRDHHQVKDCHSPTNC